MVPKIAIIGGISAIERKALKDKLTITNMIDCEIVDEFYDPFHMSYEPPSCRVEPEDKKPRRRGQRNAHGWYNWK